MSTERVDIDPQPNPQGSRYVILHHVGYGPEHWDLMLECGGALLTWRLPLPRSTPHDLSGPAERIGDHRLAYLDFEGPIAGHRGQVRRVDQGRTRIHALSDDHCRFDLSDGLFPGMYLLARSGEGAGWHLRRAST